ncbi:hypothetical protein LG296_20180 (plasmid) [Ureibacillus chungkukjangi]
MTTSFQIIHNIGIRDQSEHIELQVAQGIIELTKFPLFAGYYRELLKSYVAAGEIILTDVELFLIGKSHYLRTTISVENYKGGRTVSDFPKF